MMQNRERTNAHHPLPPPQKNASRLVSTFNRLPRQKEGYLSLSFTTHHASHKSCISVPRPKTRPTASHPSSLPNKTPACTLRPGESLAETSTTPAKCSSSFRHAEKATEHRSHLRRSKAEYSCACAWSCSCRFGLGSNTVSENIVIIYCLCESFDNRDRQGRDRKIGKSMKRIATCIRTQKRAFARA